MPSSSSNPTGVAIQVNGQSVNIMAAPHLGGYIALAVASVGSIVLTSSSGVVLCSIPPASPAGAYVVASSNGAAATSANLSSAADAGKCFVALLSPNCYL